MKHSLSTINAPPPNALRVYGWKDHPKENGLAQFEVKGTEGHTQIIAQRKLARHFGGTLYSVTSTDGSIFTIVVSNLRHLLRLHRLRRLNRLRRLHRICGLHRPHGLTEARAQAAATLFWGGVR